MRSPGSREIRRSMQDVFRSYSSLRDEKSGNKTPFWDAVVLTTFDEAQRVCFLEQVQRKRASGQLPEVPIYVVADPPGQKLGVGGSTLHVLSELSTEFGSELYSKKLLIIHSGGSSQRLPSYSVLGKIFAPVPVEDYVSGGELFTHLYQRERFHENEVHLYISEVILALALEHLHKLGIIYRDIKLENILLDLDGHIVLTDFGLSKDFLSHETEHRAHSFCGTVEYVAPEVVQGGAHGHDQAVDWWSVGVLTCEELSTGASPFTVEGEKSNRQEISRRILKTRPPLHSNLLPEEVRDLI